MNMNSTTRELAERLRVKPQTVRKWRLTGRGPRYTRLSDGRGRRGRVIYTEKSIQEWLDAHEFGSTTEESLTEAAP
jgi:hypothetical protein